MSEAHPQETERLKSPLTLMGMSQIGLIGSQAARSLRHLFPLYYRCFGACSEFLGLMVQENVQENESKLVKGWITQL